MNELKIVNPWMVEYADMSGDCQLTPCKTAGNNNNRFSESRK